MAIVPLSIFLVSFVIVCYTTRRIIVIAQKKSLFDEPSSERKVHLSRIPNLGGVPIFLSTLLTALFFIPASSIPLLHQLLVACGIVFLTGLTDDLVGMTPGKKILGQLAVATILIWPANIRIHSLSGFLGLYELHPVAGVVITAVFVLAVINAFNLIDGINCLGAGIGMFCSLGFALIFLAYGETGYFFLSIALAGSLAGFLLFNWTPARIFMGDTGSLFIGTLVAVFCIRFLELLLSGPAPSTLPFRLSPALVPALCMVPLYDTARVFTIRILNGKSPFFADRNHIHHRLLDIGLSHLQATGVLLATTAAAVIIVISTYSLNLNFQVLILAVFSGALNIILWKIPVRRSQIPLSRTSVSPGTVYHDVLVVKKEAPARNPVLQEN